MLSIGVYLSANLGNKPAYRDSVVILGKQIADANLQLIYGGSSLGLMGILATSVLEHGGKVIGVTTRNLIDKERPLTCLNELLITDSMQERKMIMQQKADAFIVMPGGLGTLEEAFETWNAIKIGVLNKPIGFLNIEGYFDTLFSFLLDCESDGFISAPQIKIPAINSDSGLLIAELIELNNFIKRTLM